MGKKNRNLPNPGGNNKEALLKQMQLDNLDKQINEKKEIAAEIETWLDAKHEKEAELAELKETVDQYGTAKEIIEQKDGIIKEAQDKKTELENEVSSLSSELENKKKDLQSYQDLIGIYENADEIISDAKEKAKGIIANADEEASKKAKEYDDILVGVQTVKANLHILNLACSMQLGRNLKRRHLTSRNRL